MSGEGVEGGGSDAKRLVSREELIAGHKEDGRAIYRREGKARLVAAAAKPGASIARIAREHGLNANQLHLWIRQSQRQSRRSAFSVRVAAGIERAAAMRSEGGVVASSSSAAQLIAVALKPDELPATAIQPTAVSPSSSPSPSTLIIELGEARIRVEGSVDPAVLASVIAAVMSGVR
jgi:transposase-like protein